MAELLALRIGKTTCKQGEMFAAAEEDEAFTPLPSILRNRATVLNSCDPETPIEYDCMVFLVRSGERNILIDTGFDSVVLAEEHGITDYHPVTTMLNRLGLKPEEITDVVVTHAHWFNMGALNSFLNARIYISVTEVNALERAVDGCNCRQAYRFEDMRNLGMVSRLHLIKRGQAVSENLRVDVIGGHTRGVLMPTFIVDGISRVLLAGDNAPLYRHLQGENLPEGWCAGDDGARDRLKSRCYHAFALPGRDPLVMTRYPEVVPGVVRIMSSEAE